MISRLLFFVPVLHIAALAQVQLVQFDGVRENPVAGIFDVGTATPGDTLETRLRLRNTGSGPAAFQTLSLAGEGFRIAAAPSLPYTIAPGSEAEFRLAFNPGFAGTYSAFLAVNTIQLTLRGTAIPAATLMLAGSTAPLAAGTVINLGSVERGGSRVQDLRLLNSGSSRIAIAKMTVSGAGFRGPIGQTAPLALNAGESATFQLAFEPVNSQPAQGVLTIDQRSFNLAGLGLDPPLPSASIRFGSLNASSAQQNSISIDLASASPVDATGTLTLDFRPNVAGVTDDTAVQFLSGPRRTASLTISAGEKTARFGNQAGIAFQTGTTAGTIVFTLKLPNSTIQNQLTIAPATVNLDSTTAVRRANDLDVSLIGSDNTYSISQLAFTFYDRTGNAMTSAPIRVDATAPFKQYFGSTQAGGAFAMRATFPLTGTQL